MERDEATSEDFGEFGLVVAKLVNANASDQNVPERHVDALFHSRVFTALVFHCRFAPSYSTMIEPK
jgi:hypothetical protein